MKKLYITIILLLFAIGKMNAQGSDVIICIDNSGSVDATEYAQMSASVKAIITNVLACNPSNRVSVIHYGTVFAGLSTTAPRIFIESDFTNNTTTAQNFSRRLGSGDHYHEAVGLIGNALDHINNVDIVSPQKILNRTIGNSLVVFLFTDAFRSNGGIASGSYLVNFNATGISTDPAFQNFTAFKNNRGATFIIVHKPDALNSVNAVAAASIASRGGSYNGSIEGYPADPDGNNLPRFYLQKTDFTLTAAEITTVSQNICSVANVSTIRLNPVNENCPLFPLDVTGTFTIPTGAVVSNVKLEVLNGSGTVVGTLLNPTITGNTFSFPVNLINFGTASPMTGNFEFRISATVTFGSATTITSTSANAGPDVSFADCSTCCANCCVDNQSLSSPVLASYVDTRQANLRIQATNTIYDGAFASYHAGNYVLLKNGFVAQAGSRVHSYIAGCTGTYILKESQNEKDDSNIIDGREDGTPNEIELISNDSKNITISPNPNNGIFQISLNEIAEGTIQITDLIGFTVFKSDFKNQSTFEINMQDQPKGIYIVRIHSGNGVFTGKIIKN